MLTHLECLFQRSSIAVASFCVMLLKLLLSEMLDILVELIFSSSSLINSFSSLLFLVIVCFIMWMCSFLMAIDTVKGTWSDGLHKSGIIW